MANGGDELIVPAEKQDDGGVAEASATLSEMSQTSSDSDINTGGRVTFLCCICGRNQCVLALSLILFACITTAQAVGAIVAGSMALLADCGSMALDTIAYAGNLFAECRQEQDKELRRRNALIAAGFSYFILFGISSYFFVTGLITLWSPSSASAVVNPWIVLGFAIAGIVVDVVSILPYILAMRRASEEAKLNLSSALSHVSADLLRSTSTLVESIVLFKTDLDPNKVDAITVLVVTSSIFIGMGMPLVKWFIAVNEYRAARLGLEIVRTDDTPAPPAEYTRPGAVSLGVAGCHDPGAFTTSAVQLSS